MVKKYTNGITVQHISTLFISSDYKRKQPYIKNKDYGALSTLKDNLNGRFTIGTLIYEILQFNNFTDYNDYIDTQEQEINSELLEFIPDQEIQKIDLYKTRTDKRSSIARYNTELINPESKDQVNIRLPKAYLNNMSLNDNISNLNNAISKGLKQYVQSPYNCRLDRIRVKEQILRYIKNDVDPDQEIIKNILDKLDILDIMNRDQYINKAKDLSYQDQKIHIKNIWLNESLNLEEIGSIVEKANNLSTAGYGVKKIESIFTSEEIEDIKRSVMKQDQESDHIQEEEEPDQESDQSATETEQDQEQNATETDQESETTDNNNYVDLKQIVKATPTDIRAFTKANNPKYTLKLLKDQWTLYDNTNEDPIYKTPSYDLQYYLNNPPNARVGFINLLDLDKTYYINLFIVEKLINYHNREISKETINKVNKTLTTQIKPDQDLENVEYDPDNQVYY